MLFADLPLMKYLANIVDILLVWYVIYKLIMIVRGTKAVQLMKGIFVILLVRLISEYPSFSNDFLDHRSSYFMGVFGHYYYFSAGIRRALEQLGRGRFFARSGSREEEVRKPVLESIFKAVDYMAKRRIGALISVERETGMGDYVETGIELNSKISCRIVNQYFYPEYTAS